MNKISIKINRELGIKFLFLVLMILTFLRYGMEMNLSTNLLLVVSLLIITFGNNDEIIAMCLSCIPLYSSFDYLYAILYGCIVMMLKNIRRIKVNLLFIAVIILFVWELLHSIEGYFSIRHLIVFFTPYLFLVTISACCRDKVDYNYVSNTFSCFLILTGINLILRTALLSNGNLISALQNIGRLGKISETSSVIGGQINPNSLGIMCSLALTMLLQNYLCKNREKYTLFFIFVILILGVLTLSKTYIVLLGIMFIFFVLGYEGDLIKKVKLTIVIAFVIAAVYFVMICFFPSVYNTFINRWLAEDISNGRLSIFLEVTKCIESNPSILFFGIGLQGFTEGILQYVSIAPHDAISEVLMTWGLPGIIFLIFLTCVMISDAKKRNTNIKLLNFIPIIIVVSKGILGHLITSGYTMLALSLAYLSLVTDFTNSKSISKY